MSTTSKKAKSAKGSSKGGAKKSRKVLRDNVQGVTKPSLRRLARRAGVKRINGLVYEELRSVLRNRLAEIIQHTSILTNYRRGNLVLLGDAIHGIFSATGSHVTYLVDKGGLTAGRKK